MGLSQPIKNYNGFLVGGEGDGRGKGGPLKFRAFAWRCAKVDFSLKLPQGERVFSWQNRSVRCRKSGTFTFHNPLKYCKGFLGAPNIGLEKMCSKMYSVMCQKVDFGESSSKKEFFVLVRK